MGAGEGLAAPSVIPELGAGSSAKSQLAQAARVPASKQEWDIGVGKEAHVLESPREGGQGERYLASVIDP